MNHIDDINYMNDMNDMNDMNHINRINRAANFSLELITRKYCSRLARKLHSHIF